MILKGFPVLRQTFNYDCGAKSVQAILAYYGLDVREDELIKEAGTTKKGTSIKGITKTLKKYGLKVKPQVLTIKKLKKIINKGEPVVLLVQAWTDTKNNEWKTDWIDGHYVIAIGYKDDKIYFEDPSESRGRTYLTEKELTDRWHDTDGKKKYYNFGIVVKGKKSRKHLFHMD